MDRRPNKIQSSIVRILVKVYKRFEKIWPTIDILIVYMFLGLSMGEVENLSRRLPKIFLLIIYYGGISAFLMLNTYCRKNELKIFRKINTSLFGFIIWCISFSILSFL